MQTLVDSYAQSILDTVRDGGKSFNFKDPNICIIILLVLTEYQLRTSMRANVVEKSFLKPS